MAKIESVIKTEIVRLARREMRAAFLPLKKEVRQMSIKLSGLSKGIASLNRLAKELHLGEASPKLESTPEEVKASRLTAGHILGLRRKIGISQRELGILTGTSPVTVLAWEKGKFKPKANKKAVLVALRKLGKREARKLLAQKASAPGKRAQAEPGIRKAGARKGKYPVRKKTPAGKRRR